MSRPHFPIATLTYNGSLIVAAAQAHPEIAPRLPANYIATASASLGKITADVAAQKTAKGELGNRSGNSAERRKFQKIEECGSLLRLRHHRISDLNSQLSILNQSIAIRPARRPMEQCLNIRIAR